MLTSFLIHKREGRHEGLDLIRGILVLSMVLYHIAYFARKGGVLEFSLKDPWIMGWRLSIEIPFVTLMGLSMVQAFNKGKPIKKRFLRVCFIGLCALLMTLLTYGITHLPQTFVEKECYIKFGLLHYAFVIQFLLWPVVKKPLLALGLSFGVLCFYAFQQMTQREVITEFWPSMFGYPIHYDCSLDFYPIIPWVSLSLLGIAIGHWAVIPMGVIKVKSEAKDPLLWIGRNSLLIYLLHIPVIWLTYRSLI